MSSVSYIKHDLGWLSFFPRVVRLCTFKVGVLPKSTWYQRAFLSARCFGTLPDFSLDRAKETIAALKTLGEATKLTTEDKEAKIGAIHLEAATIRTKIEELGGTWEKVGEKIVIQGPNRPSWNWSEYYSVLKKVFQNEEVLDGKTVLVTSEGAQDIPFGEEDKKTECVLIANLAKTFALHKSEAAYFLGKGLDVCVYDVRGSLDSLGYPTEAGVYHDIDAVGDFLFKTKGYEPAKTLIYGSCGESFTATHLFKKYHDQGINLFLQNAPKSMDSVLNKINFIARWIFKLVRWCIQAPFSSQCNKSLEDFFNSEAKIKSLAKRDSGYVIMAKTEGDTTAPPEEVDDMASLIREKGSEVEVLSNGATEGLPKGSTDPHLANPYRNPRFQATINQMLFTSPSAAV